MTKKKLFIIQLIGTLAMSGYSLAYTNASCGLDSGRNALAFHCCVSPWDNIGHSFWSDNLSCYGGMADSDCSLKSMVKYSASLEGVCKQQYGDQVIIHLEDRVTVNAH